MPITQITRLFPVWTVAAAVVGFVYPEFFVGLEMLITPGLVLIMLFMGLTLQWSDFHNIIHQLPVLSVGITLQFGIMPFTGLFIANWLNLPVDIAIGMILAGSVAGGTASNVICYLARGDVALSISMTAASTLIGSFVTPILVSMLANQFIVVDPWAMMLGLAKIVLAPVIVGVVINHCCSEKIKKITAPLPLLSMATIALMIAIIVATNAESIPQLGGVILLAVALHNGVGLSLGYLSTFMSGFDKKSCKTVAIEVGMQNSGMAVVLATHFFSPAAALPAIFFSIWHNITGSMLAAMWAKREVRDMQAPRSS